MSEELFAEEVKFPDDLDTMLSMSIQYDKLENIIRFILDLLKRHEQGLRMSFSKQNIIAPEIYSFHSYKEATDSKIATVERNLNKNNIKIEEVKQSLESRGDTVETLKYLLNMITEHDSNILICKKQVQDMRHQNSEFENRLKSIEEGIKGARIVNQNYLKQGKTNKKVLFSENTVSEENEIDGENSADSEEAEDREIIKEKMENKNNKEITDKDSGGGEEEEEQKNQKMRIEIRKVAPLQKSKELMSRETAYKVPSRRYKKTKQSPESLTARVHEDHSLENSILKSDKSQPRFYSKSPVSKFLDPITLSSSIVDTPEGHKSVPLIDSPLSQQEFSKTQRSTFQLTAPSIPLHIKELLLRIQNIEKTLESPQPEENEVKNRLGKLESMYKFIEGVLDSCEPLTIRNREEIMKIVRNLKNLETNMANKLNTEEFDAIKTLVIALASGSPKHDPNAIIPTREINMIRTLEKKISDIEIAISDIVKIYPENIEEVTLKLRRIEQKLEFKADDYHIVELTKIINDLQEKQKNLSNSLSNKEKIPSQVNKQSDSTLFSSLNRRLSSFEEIIRNLKIPYGMDLTHLWDEVKKIWDTVKYISSSLDEFKKQEASRINDILQILNNKPDTETLKTIEDKIKKQNHEMTERFTSQFAEKLDMRRGMKYLETLIKDIDGIKVKPEGDDAMLARKPLGGWSCGSCEKKLESLTGRIANHSPWSKLPLRDPSERILKAGPGFSKMLTSIHLENIKNKADVEDITLPSVRHTERSITPQP